MGGVVTASGAVNAKTSLLVRGDCSIWAFGDFGKKEWQAAEMLRRGQPIALVHDFEFRKL
jgi:hypothetical protein